MRRKQRYDTEYEDEFAELLNADPSTVINIDEDSTPDDWHEPATNKQEIGLAPEPDEQIAEDTNTEKPQRRRKRGSYIGKFFTGSVLSQDEITRRLPVLVFIVFLMLLYIANGFHIQHKYSRLDDISDDLKRLKTESVTSSAVRMTATRQSEIEKLLQQHNIPLIIDNTPPRLIE